MFWKKKKDSQPNQPVEIKKENPSQIPPQVEQQQQQQQSQLYQQPEQIPYNPNQPFYPDFQAYQPSNTSYPQYEPYQSKSDIIEKQKPIEAQKQLAQTFDERQLAEEALRQIQDTNSMAAEANLNLYNQGEQLSNINEKLNKHENKLNKIEYIQQNIKSGWGQFKNLFRKPSEVDEEKDKKQFEGPVQLSQQNSSVSSQASSQKQQQQGNNSKIDINQLAGANVEDLRGKLTKEEREKILDEINSQLDQLKNQHKNMNQALNQQNRQIDHISDKMDKQQVQMKHIQDTGQKILNKK